FGNGAVDARGTVGPRRRASPAVPNKTADQVVAVAQASDVGAHLVIGVGSDEAVGSVHGSADPDGATAPRRRAPLAVPANSGYHIVAVAKGGVVRAPPVFGPGPDEAVAGAPAAAAPRRCSVETLSFPWRRGA